MVQVFKKMMKQFFAASVIDFEQSPLVKSTCGKSRFHHRGKCT